MKQRISKLWVLLLPLIFLSCPDDFGLDLNCLIEHATTVIKLESDLLGETEKVIVNITWTWLVDVPTGDAIIVERSLDDSLHFVILDTLSQIENPMYYSDDDSLLAPNLKVYYRLGLYHEQKIDYFKYIGLVTPGSQHFYKPDCDTVGDTLTVVFARLPEFDNCSFAIYKAIFTEPESLINLKDALFDTSLAYPDTSFVIALPDSVFADTALYTIKIISSESIQLITDTSIGFRAFFKKP